MKINKKYLTSFGIKLVEVSASACLSYAITQLADMSGTWVPILTIGLQALQGMLAKKVGDPDTANYK